jgi:hypothetical protein
LAAWAGFDGSTVGVDDLFRQAGLMHHTLLDLSRSPRWRLVYERDEIFVFRRR